MKCKCEKSWADIDENGVVHVHCLDCGWYAMMSLELWNQIRSGKLDYLKGKKDAPSR